MSVNILDILSAPKEQHIFYGKQILQILTLIIKSYALDTELFDNTIISGRNFYIIFNNITFHLEMCKFLACLINEYPAYINDDLPFEELYTFSINSFKNYDKEEEYEIILKYLKTICLLFPAETKCLKELFELIISLDPWDNLSNSVKKYIIDILYYILPLLNSSINEDFMINIHKFLFSCAIESENIIDYLLFLVNVFHMNKVKLLQIDVKIEVFLEDHILDSSGESIYYQFRYYFENKS